MRCSEHSWSVLWQPMYHSYYLFFQLLSITSTCAYLMFTDRSRHNSWDFDGYPQSLEYMIVKECRLVNTTAVRNGMKM